MARRDVSILNLLVECPWWGSVLVSGFAYVCLKFIFPSITFHGMATNAFAKGLSDAAPFVALVLLLPAPIAALNSWLKNKRFNGRKVSKKRR
jgi:restriction system protein